MVLKIYCDGGARGNPGPAAAAFIVYGPSGNLREKRGKYLGTATNNVAEYTAVIEALKYIPAIREPVFDTQFFLDSDLVVNQLNGLFKVKDAKLRELLVQTRTLEQSLSPVRITYTYIPRAQNFEADHLVNETLDNNL